MSTISRSLADRYTICRQAASLGRDPDHQSLVLSPKQYLLELAGVFPCLASRISFLKQSGWINEFMATMGTASSGERHAMLFLANVWNPGYAAQEGWRFDLADALAEWDRPHLAAFAQFCANPYFP